MISKSSFGQTADGEKATLYTIQNGAYSLSVCDYGATVISLIVPDRDGTPTDVVLAHRDVAPYTGSPKYFGATVGRVANRIENGVFTLNGKTYPLAQNDGYSCLHGGDKSFYNQFFTVREVDDHTLELHRLSPDGEEGFPGNLTLSVTMSMSESGVFRLDYEATADADTPFNVTNHTYFNLNGFDSDVKAENHFVQILADRYQHNDTYLIGEKRYVLPSGQIRPVEGSLMDLREPVLMATRMYDPWPELKDCYGYDHNYILADAKREHIEKAAVVRSPLTGITMTVYTDQPGMQFFNQKTTRILKAKGEQKERYTAFCFETQGWPNATAHADFPSVILHPSEVFRSATEYRFAIE